MRLFSWAGAASMAVAAAGGYGSCERTHRNSASNEPIPYVVEFAGANEPPVISESRREPVEVIDLACLPATTSMNQFVQTTEPPLAAPDVLAGGLRVVNFEVVAGGPDAPEPAPLTLPYINDEPDDAPATLPPLGDVPSMEMPTTPPQGPLFATVWRFFHAPTDSPATDKVPFGQPPVSERPSIADIGPSCEPAPSPTKVVGPPKPDSTTAPK